MLSKDENFDSLVLQVVLPYGNKFRDKNFVYFTVLVKAANLNSILISVE